MIKDLYGGLFICYDKSMRDIQTEMPDINLSTPNPERDAPFALNWFASKHGKNTLLLMGNAEHEIEPSTLDSERRVIEEFVQLEKENKQLTWMIRDQDKTIGAVWIELIDTSDVKSPGIHIMIGDKGYRGRGIGRAVINELLKYLATDLKANEVYSRHLVGNYSAKRLLESCGFSNEGKAYSDANNLNWQNVHLRI
jgi:RimJ/RimL family protein N-acetyltransferase